MDHLGEVIALVLILEGLLPFLSPAAWRDTMLKLAQLEDGQIRFVALLAIVAGLLMLALVR